MKIAGGECIFSFFCHLLSLYSSIFYTSMEPWSLLKLTTYLFYFLLHFIIIIINFGPSSSSCLLILVQDQVWFINTHHHHHHNTNNHHHHRTKDPKLRWSFSTRTYYSGSLSNILYRTAVGTFSCQIIIWHCDRKRWLWRVLHKCRTTWLTFTFPSK